MYRVICFSILLTTLVAREVTAQVFTPTFMAPQRSSDTGIYLSDGPGEFSVEGIWRGSFGEYDLGLRGGVADTEDLSILLAAEYRNPLATGTPLDLAFTGAVQGVVGDRSAVGVVAGLSVGDSFGGAQLVFTPYLHPRIGLVEGFGAHDFELELLADFGLDIRFNPEMDLRFGVGIDDNATDFGVGFAWRRR